MHEAAATQQIDPRRVSFTATLKILRCRLPECPASQRGSQRWYRRLVEEVLARSPRAAEAGVIPQAEFVEAGFLRRRARFVRFQIDRSEVPVPSASALERLAASTRQY